MNKPMTDDEAFKKFWDESGEQPHLGVFAMAVAAWDACRKFYTEGQEPVAVIIHNESGQYSMQTPDGKPFFINQFGGAKLYLAPPAPMVRLTDVDIDALRAKANLLFVTYREFKEIARVVESEVVAKNGGK